MVVGSGAAEELIEGFVDRPQSLRLDIDSGKLYWSVAVASPAPGSAAIQRSSLDGSDLENLLFSGSCNPYCPISAMALNETADSLYWFTWDGSFPAIHSLFRSTRTGSDVNLLNTFDNVVLDVVLDASNRQLFWIEGKLPGALADHAIWKASLQGTNPEQVLSVFDGPPPTTANLAVDIDDDRIYWVTDSRAVRRARFDGSEIENLITIEGDSTVLGDIALDVPNGKMYWSATYGGINTFPSGVIHRANLDGSGIEELVRINPGSIGAFAIDFTGLVSRESVALPSAVELGSAYPNPANESTNIPVSLSQSAFVTLTVFDLLGRKQKVVDARLRPGGEHHVFVRTDDLPSGVYIVRLDTGNLSVSRMLTIRR